LIGESNVRECQEALATFSRDSTKGTDLDCLAVIEVNAGAFAVGLTCFFLSAFPERILGVREEVFAAVFLGSVNSTFPFGASDFSVLEECSNLDNRRLPRFGETKASKATLRESRSVFEILFFVRLGVTRPSITYDDLVAWGLASISSVSFMECVRTARSD